MHLQRSARTLGAVAASAFGAGFGGSVWAMVAADESAAFLDAWSADYGATHPRAAEHARFLVTGPALPASSE